MREENKVAQTRPKSGDLFDMGQDGDFKLVPLKAHPRKKRITIRHGELNPDTYRPTTGIAIDYWNIKAGGWARDKNNKVVKVWRGINKRGEGLT